VGQEDSRQVSGSTQQPAPGTREYYTSVFKLDVGADHWAKLHGAFRVGHALAIGAAAEAALDAPADSEQNAVSPSDEQAEGNDVPDVALAVDEGSAESPQGDLDVVDGGALDTSEDPALQALEGPVASADETGDAQDLGEQELKLSARSSDAPPAEAQDVATGVAGDEQAENADHKDEEVPQDVEASAEVE